MPVSTKGVSGGVRGVAAACAQGAAWNKRQQQSKGSTKGSVVVQFIGSLIVCMEMGSRVCACVWFVTDPTPCVRAPTCVPIIVQGVHAGAVLQQGVPGGSVGEACGAMRAVVQTGQAQLRHTLLIASQ